MKVISISLSTMNMTEAFKQAKEEAFNIDYRNDFSITLLNVSLKVSEDIDWKDKEYKVNGIVEEYVFNFSYSGG